MLDDVGVLRRGGAVSMALLLLLLLLPASSTFMALPLLLGRLLGGGKSESVV